MKLEEMQELADAIETVEEYRSVLWVRSLILVAKIIGWISVGFLIGLGQFIFNRYVI